MDPAPWISSQNVHLVWLVLGMVLLAVSLLVFEPIIAALGFAAIITAIAALSVKSFSTQLLLWGILSTSLAIVMRGMVPKVSKELEPPSEGDVSMTIPRGGLGEVEYEGTTWSARCQLSDVAITAGQRVHVVGRQGNTLIVLPMTFPDEPMRDRQY